MLTTSMKKFLTNLTDRLNITIQQTLQIVKLKKDNNLPVEFQLTSNIMYSSIFSHTLKVMDAIANTPQQIILFCC